MKAAQSRSGGAAAVLAAALLAAALATLPELPGTAAAPQEVFAFFLDRGGTVRVAAALLALAMLLVAVLFAALRTAIAAPETGAAVFGLGLLAVGLQGFAAATLATLATRAETGEPASSRSLLDLAEMAVAVSGLAFALALAACALAARREPGLLPSPVVRLAALAAAGCALWAGRLLFDSGPLAADAFLGSTLGWLLLLSWIAVTGLSLLGGRRDEPRPEAEPKEEREETVAIRVVRERIRIRTGRGEVG